MMLSCGKARRSSLLDRRADDHVASWERSEKTRDLLIEEIGRSCNAGLTLDCGRSDNQFFSALTAEGDVALAFFLEKSRVDTVPPGKKCFSRCDYLCR